MQAVILAAGEGVRMRPLTLERPKTLVEVAGKPLLWHIIEALPDSIDELIINIRYRGEQIREYMAREFPEMPVHFAEQGTQKGTAAALDSAKPFIKGRFLLTFADDLLDSRDLEKIIEHEHALLISQHEHPERFGVVEIDETGRLISIEEKPATPKTNLISTGVMALTKRIFDFPSERIGDELVLTGSMKAMAQVERIQTVEATFWQPVGFPADIRIAEERLVHRGHI